MRDYTDYLERNFFETEEEWLAQEAELIDEGRTEAFAVNREAEDVQGGPFTFADELTGVRG